MSVTYCSVDGCDMRIGENEVSFFRCPKDDLRAENWLRACGREDLKEKFDRLRNHRLCAAHFEDRMYLNDLKNRLMPQAAPTIFPSLEGGSHGSEQNQTEHDYCNTLIDKRSDSETESTVVTEPEPLLVPTSALPTETKAMECESTKNDTLSSGSAANNNIFVLQLSSASSWVMDIYTKRCRICLNQKLVKFCKNVQDKHHDTIPSILSMMTFCIPKLAGHILPKEYVCLQCLEELVTCVEFIEKCVASDNLIQTERAAKELRGRTKFSITPKLKVEANEPDDIEARSYSPNLYDHDYVKATDVLEDTSNMKIDIDEQPILPDTPEPIETVDIKIQNQQEPQNDSNDNNCFNDAGNDEDDDYDDEYMSASDSEAEKASPEDAHLANCGLFKHVPQRYRRNQAAVTPKETAPPPLKETAPPPLKETAPPTPAETAPPITQVICNKCGRLFPSRLKLLEHQQKFRGLTECAYFCNVCKNNYSIYERYLNHHCDPIEEDCVKCAKKQGHICFTCKKGFIEHQSFVEHECTEKQEPECVHCLKGDGHTCKKCLKTYYLHKSYDNHHCIDKEVTFCVRCSDRVLKEDYKRHLENHNKIKCEKCRRGFSSIEIMKIHMLTHTDPSFKQCPICENVYRNKELLNVHLKEGHTTNYEQEDQQSSSVVLLQVYDDLNKDTVTSEDSNMLLRTLTEEVKENAPEVKIENTTSVEKKKKVNRNDSSTKLRPGSVRTKKTYYCYICKRKFHVFNKMLHHFVQTNLHRQEFPCRSCKDKFLSYVDLKNHLSNGHNYAVFCDKCFTAFESLEQLQKHQSLYQTKGTPCGFCVCEKCNRRFWVEAEYEEHLQFPNCECKRCPTCSKLIATVDYNEHMAEHLPYPCSKCSNRFTSDNSLTAHMQTQHNEASDWVPCPDCGNFYRDKLSLKGHQRRVHRNFIRPTTSIAQAARVTVKPKAPRKLFNCPVCYRKFREYASLVYHVVTQESHKDVFPCNQCDTQLTSYLDIKKHLRERHGLQHFCGNCFASFHTEKELNHHHKTSLNKSRPCGFWVCEKCNKRFAAKEAYDDHCSLSSCDLNMCRICKNVFSEEEFKNHSHQKYMCEMCGKSFTSAQSLNLHLATKKHTSPEELIVCEICGNSFTAQYIKMHMKRVHQSQPKTLMCSYCSLRFFYPRQLYLHEKIHTNTKDVACKECGKSFRTKPSMTLHYRTVHLKLKPIKCKECGHEFSRRGNLLQHLKVHNDKDKTGQKPRRFRRRKSAVQKEYATGVDEMYGTSSYGPVPHDPGLPVKCCFCNKTLNSLAFLKAHVRNSHAKLRRYKCNLCEMTFIIKTTLIKHLKLHQDPLFKFRCKICFKKSRTQEEYDEHAKKHTKFSFECDSCPKRFAREYLLESHKETEHPNHEENNQKFEEMLEIAFKNVVFLDEPPKKRAKRKVMTPD